MDWLRDLFETNRIILLTVYGQVFFVLGLAIALQSLQRSTLPLARPLPWLAAFGIVHGFHEWGYLFIPIQSGYLAEPIIEALLVAQLLMKGVSFALLLRFGIELRAALRGSEAEAPGRLRFLPAAALVGWALATALVSLAVADTTAVDPRPWLAAGRIDQALRAIGTPIAVGDVLARWMLATPAALLAAIGLLRSAAEVGPLARPPVGAGLRAAAVAFAVYALVGGLVGAAAPFPPASFLNAGTVLDSVGIPIEVFRSITGLVIAVAVIAALDLFEQETDRALAEARRRDLLARERQRISRDLHDGIIQSIYAAGLHLEEVNASIGPDKDAPRARIATIMGELNRITADLRRTIFDLRTAGLDAQEAEEIVRGVADELRANTLVDLDLAVTGDWLPRLSPEQAEELRQIVHEAFSNVLRHADARRVTVRLVGSRRRLTLDIRDDGSGFEPDAAAERARTGGAQGLANLRRRAELLGARLRIESAPGQGTALSLTMPVTAARRSPRAPRSP